MRLGNLAKTEVFFAILVAVAMGVGLLAFGAGRGQAPAAEPSPTAKPAAVRPTETPKAAAPLTAVLRPVRTVTPQQAQEKGCLSCHEGIEDINPKMVSAGITCITCHKGNPSATAQDEAHLGMIVNPGDFRVVEQTCGQCHNDNGSIKQVVSRGQSNHVPRSLRSIMATAAGEIAGTRYLWAAQSPKTALFAVRPISDTDNTLPREGVAVQGLQQLPPGNMSDADNLLRTTCLKCHLWTRGEANPGLHRSSGCSACHVLYNDDGLSQSVDPTVSRTDTGHAARHEITARVPTSQCLRCHNDGGARIGLNYVGLIVNSAAVPYQDDGTVQPKLYGINTLHVRPDVHYERGMDCIDCHTSKEMHGDGNLYARKEYEVKVRCESCHGTTTSGPTLRDSEGEPLWNLRREGQDVVLEGKVSGKRHRVPQIKSIAETGGIDAAMTIPAHLTELPGRLRLQCTACHARTAQQCYGCHMQRDDRQTSPVDWVEGLGEGAEPVSVAGKWFGDSLFRRWEDPILGVDTRGLVAPFIPGGQAFLTHIGQSGEILALNKATKTSGISADGTALPGISMNATQPHSVQKESRTCESCHSSDRALGLGSGLLDSRAAGLPVVFPLDQMVDRQGVQLQDTSHFRARPFTKQEMGRINLVDSCLGCHRDTDNQKIWGAVTNLGGLSGSAREHQSIISRIFKLGSQGGSQDW